MGQGSGRRSRSGKRNKNIEPKSEANSFPNIPEELIVEILSRLPHDSLSRFRCVSKQWSSLISDSKLIALSKRRKVLVMSRSYDGSFWFHSIDQHCSLEKVKKPWEKNLRLHDDEVEIYGSCNGLFLLRLKADLYLWNPLNGYVNKVLSYHRLMQPPYEITTAGLCYDSSTNGYKAVMAMDKFVMVGYFRKKCWKEVRFPSNIGTIRSGPIVNGLLHWFANNTNFVSTHCIFSFDPRVDEFKKVPLPKPRKDGERNILLGLGVLDECLSLTRLHQGRQGNAEVWVMKEYGAKKSWNLMFVTNLTFWVYSELVPLCCTKGGKVLMRERFWNGSGVGSGVGSGHVSMYNSNGDLDGDIPSPYDCKYSMKPIEYVESSVKPIGYKWEKEERRGIATYVEQFLSAPPRKMKKGKGDSNWKYFYPEKEATAKGTRKKPSLKSR